VQQNRDGEVKLFSRFGHFSLFLLVTTTLLFGGSFEEFKKSQTDSYKKFKDPRDNGFSSYLKSQWDEYQAYITKPLYEKPKPKVITPLPRKKIAKVGPTVVIKVPEISVKKEPVIVPKSKIKYDVEFDFFGEKIGFWRDGKISSFLFYPRTEAGISSFFTALASSEYEKTLLALKREIDKLALNDWGTYLLVKRYAKEIYKTEDEARIYEWFLLSKLGYDVKIALAGGDVYLLHYVKETVYQTPRYRFKDKYYYLLGSYDAKKIKRLYTYKGHYPNANRPLDFSLKHIPNFPQNRFVQERSFKDDGRVYQFSYTQNRNLIAFMLSYPQVSYDIYFNAAMDIQTYGELAKDIKRYIDGKKMAEAMNFVLKFVQKAFIYKRDDMQFGREKVMFSDETLYYDASDCEDRAVLYAQLVKKLFGVMVIGVKYSDHMSTALYIPMQGDSVEYKRRRFVVADPTYINANIGMAIPKYRSVVPDSFIVLKN
jgi:hypothetical protein